MMQIVRESGTAGHAFISYVHDDADRVDRLQQFLKDAGIRVWRDTDSLWPGDIWRDKIRQAITSDALVFLACFSTASVARTRTYQNDELLLAIEEFRQRPAGSRWLIPIRFDECEIPNVDIGGNLTLRSIHRADLFDDRFDEGARRLVASVQRILGPARGDPTGPEGDPSLPQPLEPRIGYDRGERAPSPPR
jgi:TIR domain